MADFDLADVLPDDRTKGRAGNPVFRVLRILLVVAAALLLLFFALAGSFFAGIIPGFQAYRITTDSTAPTLVTGDHIVADMHHFRQHAPARGDVVVFLLPSSNGNAMFVKRVIGLPGDVISGTPGSITLNGQLLREPYVNAEHSKGVLYDPKATFGPVAVPPGHVFLMGDNRLHSYDSRHYGPVSIGQLKGKALYISWSEEFSRIGKRVE